MKRLILTLMTVSLLFVYTDGFAAGSGFDYWIKALSNKLRNLSSESADNNRTSVVGVKGAKDSESEELYWKDSPQSQSEEVEALEKAVAAASEGKSELAIKELEAFLEKYPDSALASDAEQGLRLLKDKESGG